jgi:hypothetical protein
MDGASITETIEPPRRQDAKDAKGYFLEFCLASLAVQIS